MKCLFFTLTMCLFNLTAFGQVQNSLLSIQGKNLVDECGQTIVLKGVNHGNVWTTNWGINELSQISLTGSNAVRICLETTWINWEAGGVSTSTTGAQIEPIIQACLANKMIPILEIHDFTSYDSSQNATQTLPLATNFWTRSDILSVLKNYQNWLILNIANEPEHWDISENSYYLSNKNAILTLRNAGLNLPIMIDGMHWGQDHQFFINYGSLLLNDDPLHKLLFSIHAYWNTVNVPNTNMSSILQAMNNSNLPFVFGEISKSDNGAATPNINYQYLMQLCNQFNFGYLAWWWGFENPGSNNVLSMTPTGLYNGLTGFGAEIAITDPNSIQNTAIRPNRLVTGSCFLDVEDFKNTQIKVFPNPVIDIAKVSAAIEIKSFSIFDLNGREIVNRSVNASAFEIDLSELARGIYSLKISTEKADETHRIIK